MTALFGLTHPCSPRNIEIVLTFKCDLLCNDCSIMCAQAPSEEQMTVEQITRFIQESVAQSRHWKVIRIIGGEPTLHPQIIEVLQLLSDYKREFSPKSRIQLCTNGYSSRVKDVLTSIPRGIEVDNSGKTSSFQNKHIAVNYAPVDQRSYVFSDFANGCWVCVSQGWGLSLYGYYHCNVASSIDRVFGFDIGRKTLTSQSDPMLESARTLCRYCGFFRKYEKDMHKPGFVSPTWKTALEKYVESPPQMTRY